MCEAFSAPPQSLLRQPPAARRRASFASSQFACFGSRVSELYRVHRKLSRTARPHIHAGRTTSLSTSFNSVRLAAVPLDVRKGYVFSRVAPHFSGLRPESGAEPQLNQKNSTEGRRPSAQQAAEPPLTRARPVLAAQPKTKRADKACPPSRLNAKSRQLILLVD